MMFKNKNGEYCLSVNRLGFVSSIICMLFMLEFTVGIILMLLGMDRTMLVTLVMLLTATTIYFFCHVKNGAFLFIYISDAGVRYKDTTLPWDAIYITMCNRLVPPGGNNPDYFYFADRYLSMEEANKSDIARLSLSRLRVNMILKYYNKHVQIIPCYSSNIIRYMRPIVKKHNDRL